MSRGVIMGGLLGFVMHGMVMSSVVVCDAPEPWQTGFQDPATPLAAGIMNLHHDIMFFMAVIAGFVFTLFGRTISLFGASKNATPSRVVHGTTIEIIWTVTPSIVLMIIAVPSFALLYALEEVIDPAITIKAIGHQWYWSYEYSDYVDGDGNGQVAFDSYMVSDDDLQPGQLRLLEVDNRVVVPTHTHIRVLVTAADVLHCWAVPSLGAKLDGVPGRLNQLSLFIQREGVYYGQCSEICGVNHAFMPIVVEAVSLDKYVEWVASHTA